MLGLIIGSIFGLGAACGISNVVDRSKYMAELEDAKDGKTIVKTSETITEVFTFSTMQNAIEHPQEITFDPNKNTLNNRETVLLLNCHKHPIQVFDGQNFKTVSDSDILTITVDGNKSYLYLKFNEKEIR